MIKGKLGKQNECVNDGPPSPTEVERYAQNPSQTRLHQRGQDEHQHEEKEVEEQRQLKRSTRQRKPNPKYANVAEVMEEKELITNKDAS